MAANVFMAKLEGARQVAQLPALAGKTFTLQKVTEIGGLKQTLFLVPQAGAGTAGGGIVALQVEGARQAASFSTLVGKSVTVGQAPTVIGGGKWLVLHPAAGTAAKVFAGTTVAGGAAGAGVAGKGAAGAGVAGKGLADSSMIMMKVEGAKQAVQLPMMSGKTFTIVKPMAGAGDNMLALKPVGAMGAAGKGAGAAGAAGKGAGAMGAAGKGAGAMGAAGKGAGAAGAAGKGVISLEIQGGGGKLGALVGKTFTVGKAPVVAGNAGKWLVLQPTTGAAAKAMAGTAVAAPAVAPKAAVAKAIMVKGVAGGGVAEGAGVAAKGAGVAAKGAGVAAKAASGKAAVGMAGVAGSAKAAAGSTIWTGSGWSLGLGLGLGPWGPAILGLLGVTAVYGYLRKRRSQRSETDDEIELPGTLTET